LSNGRIERRVRSVSYESPPKRSRSLFQLIADLPGLLVTLVKAELAQAKVEFAAKAKNAGVGIGMFVVAGMLAFFALAVLIAAGVLALALVLPAWLAALIVFVVLLLLAGLLVFIGVQALRRVGSLAPKSTMVSVREDADAIKGMGAYDQ
jgi:hypothetical protein